MTARSEGAVLGTSMQVRTRLVEALKLDLVGPWAGHELAEERLQGRVRPSNWYLTGFLIPSGTAPERSADADEDDDMGGEIPESAGLAEESNEERKAAKKGFFPSSMGLSFLVPKETRAIAVIVRWGDYEHAAIEGTDHKPLSVWQRHPLEAAVTVPLTGASDPVHNVPDSAGLQLHVVERLISASDLEGHLPPGTRSVSVFPVNHRAPIGPERKLPTSPTSSNPSSRCEATAPSCRGRTCAVRALQSGTSRWLIFTTPTSQSMRPVTASRPNGRSWTALCHLLRTSWIPSAEVEKTLTVDVPGVELSMDALRAACQWRKCQVGFAAHRCRVPRVDRKAPIGHRGSPGSPMRDGWRTTSLRRRRC